MVPLAYQWQPWFTNGTIGKANGAIGITICTNGFTNGAIDINNGTTFWEIAARSVSSLFSLYFVYL